METDKLEAKIRTAYSSGLAYIEFGNFLFIRETDGEISYIHNVSKDCDYVPISQYDRENPIFNPKLSFSDLREADEYIESITKFSQMLELALYLNDSTLSDSQRKNIKTEFNDLQAKILKNHFNSLKNNLDSALGVEFCLRMGADEIAQTILSGRWPDITYD